MPSTAKSARRVALSEAERMREALDANGDQPKLANLDTGWFAVAYKKWVGLVDRARRDNREGPNLIVYRTNTRMIRHPTPHSADAPTRSARRRFVSRMFSRLSLYCAQCYLEWPPSTAATFS